MVGFVITLSYLTAMAQSQVDRACVLVCAGACLGAKLRLSVCFVIGQLKLYNRNLTPPTRQILPDPGSHQRTLFMRFEWFFSIFFLVSLCVALALHISKLKFGLAVWWKDQG